jgi:hypothetical protein
MDSAADMLALSLPPLGPSAPVLLLCPMLWEYAPVLPPWLLPLYPAEGGRRLPASLTLTWFVATRGGLTVTAELPAWWRLV